MTTPKLELNISHPWSDVNWNDFDREVAENERRQLEERFHDFERGIERPPPKLYWRASLSPLDEESRRRGSIGRREAQMKELDDKYEWELDVKHFAPDELKITLVGDMLTFEGYHDKTRDPEGHQSLHSHHFRRAFTVPRTADMKEVKAELTDAGQLIVQAPKRLVPVVQP